MVHTDCGRNFTADTGAVSCAGNSGNGKADPFDQSWNWNFSDRDCQVISVSRFPEQTNSF